MTREEPSRDMEEIEEIINCDTDAETKCKMISNILTAKPHYFKEPPINKPMVEIDLYSVIKQKYIEREVLDEIRAEIEEQVLESLSDGGDDWFTAEKVNECLEIIDKYKPESEDKDGNNN